MKCAIIGSGASATAVLKSLLKFSSDQWEIHIFGGHAGSEAIEPSASADIFRRKTHYGDRSMYRFLDRGTLWSRNIQPRPTTYFGGLTRVWGGTFDSETYDSALSELGATHGDRELIEEITEYSTGSRRQLGQSSFLIRLLNQSGKNNFHRVSCSRLAVIQRNCVLAGSCLEGCPTEAIWFAGNTLRNTITPRVALYENEVVTCLKKEGDGWLLEFSESTNIGNAYFDKVFVCAGALGSAQLVVESGLLDEVKVRDTGTVFMVAISCDRYTEAQLKLSAIWLEPIDSSKDLFAQVYPSNRYLRHQVLSKFRLPAFFGKLVDFGLSFIFPVIAYLPQEASSSAVFRRDGDHIVVSIEKGYEEQFLRGALRRLQKVFLKSRAWIPSFLSELAPPLMGYHFGASLRHGIETNSLGELDDSPNLHFCDSSVLPTIFQGSITKAMMINAARIARMVSTRT